MIIWSIFALMTAAAVMAVLWPLSRVRESVAVPAIAGERDFYLQQIAEIDRDAARGLFSPAEAEAAKAEAARRLIRANRSDRGARNAVDEPALRRRRVASTLALSVIPLVALAVYGAYGSPAVPDQPLTARLSQGVEPANMAMGEAVARIETHLAQNPTDGRGWEVLAPVYMRQGRFADAANAYARALDVLGETPQRLTSFGEALVSAESGVVSARARQAFVAALTIDDNDPKARYYLARAAEQDGDRAGAIAAYQDLVRRSPEGAPWLPLVAERLTALDPASFPRGAMPSGGAGAGAGAPDINAMVEGLAQRLRSQGGTGEEWGRLVRSYAVLGREDRARESLADARRALAGNEAGLAEVNAIASDLGISSENRTNP